MPQFNFDTILFAVGVLLLISIVLLGLNWRQHQGKKLREEPVLFYAGMVGKAAALSAELARRGVPHERAGSRVYLARAHRQEFNRARNAVCKGE